MAYKAQVTSLKYNNLNNKSNIMLTYI